MSLLIRQFGMYQEYHTKMINKIAHFIGIPLVTFALMIVFSWIHIRIPNLFEITLAWLLILGIAIYYLILDFVLGATTILAMVILNIIANYFAHQGLTKTNLIIFAVAFVIGWGALLLGHLFENKQPAFTKNIGQLLIGPIFMTAEIFFCCGYKKDLQNQLSDHAET